MTGEEIRLVLFTQAAVVGAIRRLFLQIKMETINNSRSIFAPVRIIVY